MSGQPPNIDLTQAFTWTFTGEPYVRPDWLSGPVDVSSPGFSFEPDGPIAIHSGTLLKAGDFIGGHEHNYDHLTYIPYGGILIEKLDENDNVVKAAFVSHKHAINRALVHKGVRHRLICQWPSSRYDCLYVHRDPDGNITAEYRGVGKSYV